MSRCLVCNEELTEATEMIVWHEGHYVAVCAPKPVSANLLCGRRVMGDLSCNHSTVYHDGDGGKCNVKGCFCWGFVFQPASVCIQAIVVRNGLHSQAYAFDAMEWGSWGLHKVTA